MINESLLFSDVLFSDTKTALFAKFEPNIIDFSACLFKETLLFFVYTLSDRRHPRRRNNLINLSYMWEVLNTVAVCRGPHKSWLPLGSSGIKLQLQITYFIGCNYLLYISFYSPSLFYGSMPFPSFIENLT